MNNTDTNTTMTTLESCAAPNQVLLEFVSIMSLIGCVYVIFTFLYIPALRQHPAGIMFGMSVYGACYQILFLLEISMDSISCSKIAAVVEFFLTGQESYLLMFAFDLILALKNPFSAEKERMFMYHVIAIVSSLVFALIAFADADHALFGFCWMNLNGNEDFDEIDPIVNRGSSSGIFFAVQIVFVYLFSLAAMVRSWKTLQKGLPDTFLTRKRILRHLKYYVGIFFAYWTVVFFLYTVYTVFPDNSTAKCRLWSLLSGVLLSKGLVNSIIWTRTSNIYQVLEQLRTMGYVDLPPHDDSINWALRLEILTNTTKGICDSIERSERQAIARTTGDSKFRFAQIDEISIKSKSGDEVMFYDYAPHVFRWLRSVVKISSALYRNSFEQTTKERVSEGKSGAFFYFTQDRKYVVKTLKREELKFLLSILPKYCEYVANHPQTLIARFFGCHAITMYGKTVHFVVIQSVFDTTFQIHERFDLKGSWVGRLEGRKPTGTVAVCKYCSKEFTVGGSHDQRCDARQGGLRHVYDQVGKDLNWNRQMCIPPTTAARLAKQLEQDTNFLARINSIDYSLLVGIHHRSFNVSHSSESMFDLSSYDMDAPFHRATMGGMGVEIVHGPGIYFVGMIDILQQWNLRKRMEHFARVFLMMQDRHGISVVPARQYAERFQQRVVKDLIFDHRVQNRSNATTAGEDMISMTALSPVESLQRLSSPRRSVNPLPSLDILIKQRRSAAAAPLYSYSPSMGSELATPPSVCSIGTPEDDYSFIRTPAPPTSELRMSSLPA